MGADRLEGAEHVLGGFHLDGDDVGSGEGKLGNEALGFVDHQVHVDDRARLMHHRRQGFDDDRADGYIRDELAVHDIDMDVFRAGFERLRDLIPQPKEIGGQNGWCDFYRGWHDVRCPGRIPFLADNSTPNGKRHSWG